MTLEDLSTSNNNSQDENPAGVKSSLFAERKQFSAKIKMNNGLIYRGIIHFRPTISRVKDELNQLDEKFIAITDVTDRTDKKIKFTALIAVNKIAYIAVNDFPLNEPYKNAEVKSTDPPPIQKRKITAYIDFQDGTRIQGTIFVRNFLKRAKDELNIRNEGKFIVMVDVVEPKASEEDASLLYFVNTDQVICIIPINDQIV